MALVNCKTCKAEIAASAKTCPHCGAKTPSAVRRSKIWAIILFGPIILILFVVLVGMLGS